MAAPFRPRVEMLEDRCTPAVFKVTNRDDSGGGSLRQAVFQAEQTDAADVIRFKPGLSGTIRLTTGAIAITLPLTIRGTGQNLLTIDGDQAGQIFTIDNGASFNSVKVNISGLTLTGGLDTNGGAISNLEDLTLSRMLLTGNRATFAGGAIYHNVGTLRLQRSTIRGNESATQGGGIAAFEDVVIGRSTLSGNLAGGSGGALYHDGGDLTITRSRVTANTSTTGNGGGIRASGDSLTVEDSVITGNRALGIGNGVGGGLYAPVSGTLRRTTVSGNFARNGGGGIHSTGTLTLVRCGVDGNTSLNFTGGGISHGGGSLTLTNSSLMDNRAGSDGGGLYLANTSTDSTITGCTIAGNTAEASGGGLFFDNCQPVTLTHCTVSGNRARDDGGGIHWQDSDLLTVRNSTIAFNHAGTDGSGGGGGVSNNTTAGVVLESVIVGPNTAVINPDLITLGGGNFQVSFSLIASNILISPTTNIIGQDPRLAPLAPNGGPTWTHALKKGSPAINHGQNFSGSPFDQRGQPFARRVGAGVDMGAFERQ